MANKLAVIGIIASAIVIVVILVVALGSGGTTTPATVGNSGATTSPVTVTVTEPAVTSAATDTTQSLMGDLEYLEWLNEISTECGQAINEIVPLLQNPQIGDDGWTYSLALQIYIIQSAAEETRNMVPPDSMSQIHEKFSLGMECLDDGMTLMVEGIDNNFDIESISASTEEITKGSQYLLEVTNLVNEYNDAH